MCKYCEIVIEGAIPPNPFHMSDGTVLSPYELEIVKDRLRWGNHAIPIVHMYQIWELKRKDDDKPAADPTT